MKRKRKLPSKVEDALKLTSDNIKPSGFSGRATPVAEAHVMKWDRKRKLKSKSQVPNMEWVICERQINEGFAAVQAGLRELRELIGRSQHGRATGRKAE
jgi:hypothetical protein